MPRIQSDFQPRPSVDSNLFFVGDRYFANADDAATHRAFRREAEAREELRRDARCVWCAKPFVAGDTLTTLGGAKIHHACSIDCYQWTHESDTQQAESPPVAAEG